MAWRAVDRLCADLDIEAGALDAWLARFERGEVPFAAKTCLIVEEAGLQTTSQAQVAPPVAFDPAVIERFGHAPRENTTSGETPFRKAYLQAVIDCTEVDDGAIALSGNLLWNRPPPGSRSRLTMFADAYRNGAP